MSIQSSFLILAGAGLSSAFSLTPLPLAAPDGAVSANLSAAANGTALVSWVERLPEKGHRLVFRRCASDASCEPTQEVARGSDWFVNWADLPAVATLPDGSLWAQLLRKNGVATYAYDAVLSHSHDGGASWSPLKPMHDDGSASEHGFVTLLPWSLSTMAAVWLDGRNTLASQGETRGAMTVRSAVFSATQEKVAEWQLDASTCDCCQTDAALSARGPVVVWRDRDAEELRDIQIARFENDAWTVPHYVHRDRWHMPACPVNGPAVAAREQQVWVAWYTEADGAPSLRLAYSQDAADVFSEPLQVAGAETLGRADLAVNTDGVWLSWLQEVDGKQSLWLAQFSHDLRQELARSKITTLGGRGRATGVPRLLAQNNGVWLLWTDVQEGTTRLSGALVRISSAAR